MASLQGSCLNCQQIYYQQSLLPLEYVDFTFGGQKISLLGCFVESHPKPNTLDGPKICLTCLELLRTCHSASKRTVMANDSLQKPMHTCATCYQLSPANNLMNIRLTVMNIDGRQVNLEQCVKKPMKTDANLMICLACLSVIVEEYQDGGEVDGNKPEIDLIPELVEIKIEPGLSVVVDVDTKAHFKLEPEESDPPKKAVEPKSERSSPEIFEDDIAPSPLSRKYTNRKRRYYCAHCPASFHYRSQFCTHVDNHRSDRADKDYHCHHCPTKRFTRKHSLKEHLHNYHFPQKSPVFGKEKLTRHTCPVCLKKFSNQHKFAGHLSEHKELEKLECNVCKRKFQKMWLFGKHLRQQKAVFKCTKCEMGFHHRTSLDKHMEIVHNESYVCKICSLPLFTRRTYDSHQLVRHGIRTKVRCKYCDLSFDTKRELKDHKSQHMEPVKRPFVCEQCGQTFRQENEMKIHQETHKSVEKAKCDLCPKRFKNSRTLANHVKRIHMREKARESKTEYPCTMCPLRFSRRQYLEGHMIVHNTVNRPFFQCNKCGVAYTRRQKLQKHVTKCPRMQLM